METEARVAAWFRKMGYKGVVSDKLSNICSPTTGVLWENLMEKVKPRQEVEHVRNNLIVYRLKTKNLEGQEDFSHPIELLEVYRKKVFLEERLEAIKRRNLKKQQELEELQRGNSLKCRILEENREKIEEIKRKTFLYECKLKGLSHDAQRAEEWVNLVTNVTPVEMDVNTSGQDVIETLTKCSEKLQVLLQQNKDDKKTAKKDVFHDKYFNNQNSSSFYHLNFQRTLLSSTIQENPPPKPRESFGLLPESCFEFDEDSEETFLVAPEKPQACEQKVLENEVFQKDVKELLGKFNRRIIAETISKQNEQIEDKIKFLLVDFVREENFQKISREDLGKLHFLHITLDIEGVVPTKRLEELNKSVKARQKKLISEKVYREHDLRLQMLSIGLDASLKALQQEVDLSGNLDSSRNLLLVVNKLGEINAKIEKTTSRIEDSVQLTLKTIEDFQKMSKEIFSSTKCILNFLHNVSWSKTLMENLFSKELEEFKLHNFTQNATKPEDIALENKLVQIYLPPEEILQDFVRKKIVLKKLQELVVEDFKIASSNCCVLKELNERESKLVQPITDQLNSLIYSSKNSRILGLPQQMRQDLETWTNLPVGDCIKEDLLIEGHSYKFYEKLLKDLLN